MTGDRLRGLLQIQMLLQHPRMRIAELLDALLWQPVLDDQHQGRLCRARVVTQQERGIVVANLDLDEVVRLLDELNLAASR